MSTDLHDDHFDLAALTWDDDPAKVERSRAVADAIADAVPLADVRDAMEYGCGTGQVTWQLADRLQHVVLADRSPGMLAVAQDRADSHPDADQDRFEVRRIDLETEELPEESLDLVYSSMTLHHVEDVPLVLTRLHDALRPGGHLAVADLDHDPEGHFHGDRPVPHSGFDRSRLGSMLELAGFARPEFRDVTTMRKEVDGQERSFGVFLAVTRRPGA